MGFCRSHSLNHRIDDLFCASMADVDDHLSTKVEWRGCLRSLIVDKPNLDCLLLTKRPENIERVLPSVASPRPYVCRGVTVESQKAANIRVPYVTN